MSVKLKIKERMREIGIAANVVANYVGITPQNFSNLINENVSSISFEKIAKLCEILKCEIGDIMEYVPEECKQIIPFFLDYSGTTDLLLKEQGREGVKSFFTSLKMLETKSGQKVQLFIVTGSIPEIAQSKLINLNDIARQNGFKLSFSGAISECGGFMVTETSIQQLIPRSTFFSEPNVEEALKSIYAKYGAVDYGNSYSCPEFPEGTTEETVLRCREELIEVLLMVNSKKTTENKYLFDFNPVYIKDIDIWFIDVKPTNHTKANAVRQIVEALKESYDIQLVVIGGDDKTEDVNMFVHNKQTFAQQGIKTIFIAPSSLKEAVIQDKTLNSRDFFFADMTEIAWIVNGINDIQNELQISKNGRLIL